MTQEEKAKAYDEALKKAKDMLSYKEVRQEDIEYLFPELKESEDEKIKKAILELVRQSSEILEKKNQEQMIAWLEKQGEQPKKHDVCDYCDQQGSCVYPCPMKLVEKQGEQKPAESNDIEDVLLVHDETLNNLLERYKTSATFKTLIVNLQNWWNNTRRHLLSFNIEQNSAWSEKDEEMLKLVIKSCEQCGNEYAYYWLKSLKDRIQPKQEWSEEDEKMYNAILRDVRNGEPLDKLQYDWLKSLRPQNKWKPSEEQMDMLAKVCSTLHLTSGENEIMESIYDALKELREEVVMKANEAPEKIFLFENTVTETPDDRWLSKKSGDTDIEYTRTDAFIEKACDFFEENIEEEDCKIGSSEWTELRAEYKSLDSFIRAFVNYMKGE